MKDIDFNKIKHKEVKKLIEAQKKNGVSTFEDLRETYFPGEDLSKHKIHIKEFFVEGPVESVWEHYLVADPSEVWNGNMISFGLMVSEKSNEIVYPDEKCSAAEVGQVFYVCLNIIGSFLKIAVTHKIIGIDHENKIMTLSYVEGGETVGKQDIQLSKTESGNTKITHKTFFIGQPGFREKWLYPYFHTKAINEFHANMRKSFKS
jgi:hypothetical protein